MSRYSRDVGVYFAVGIIDGPIPFRSQEPRGKRDPSLPMPAALPVANQFY